MENFFTSDPARLLRTIHTLRFLDTQESHQIADELLELIDRAIKHADAHS